MRFRDFGSSKIVHLSDESSLVSVSTTSLSDSEKLASLEKKNEKYLKPWKIEIIENSSKENYFFSVFYKEWIIGQIVLWSFDREEFLSHCLVSYWIDEEHSNNGLMTKALNLVCSHGFNDLGLGSIVALIQPDNISSIKVVSKLGFIKTGTVNESLTIQGTRRGHDTYTLSKYQ